MKYWLVFAFFSILLFSCGKNHDDRAISISMEKRDSLLVEYITKEFDYDFDSALHERSKRHFKKQLTFLRKDTILNDYSSGSHEAKFKRYRFKSFIFDDQRRPPFVVEITNDKNHFLGFFSFTDEQFYSMNRVSRREHLINSHEEDSILRTKINLQNNLNLLLEKLGLVDKHEILNLTKILCNTLRMVEITQDSIHKEVSAVCMQFELKDSIIALVKEEEKTFFNTGKGDVVMVRTQSGRGYWRFWIEEGENRPRIRAVFFSDILYHPIYL